MVPNMTLVGAQHISVELGTRKTRCEQQQTEEENTNSQQADIATLDGVATAESLTDQEPALNIAPRVMDARVNYLMVSMLRDVVRLGTGKRALALKRADIAGKTGTTNDQKDAWFSGFSPDLVTTVWVGFDQPVTLGRWAYGSNTALPIWVDYMETALQGVPEHPFEQPEGIVSARIDPATGLLAAPGQENAMFEYFREENVPKEMEKPASAETDSDHDGQQEVIPEQLF